MEIAFVIVATCAIVVIGGAIIYVLVLLALLPGRIADSRKHPDAEAIKVCSFVGMLFCGIGWLIALIWAFTGPDRSTTAIKPKMFPSEPCDYCDPLSKSRHDMSEREIEEIMQNAGVEKRTGD